MGQTVGFEQARTQMLQVQGEDRAYMKTLYSLFNGDGSVSEAEVEQKITTSQLQDAFYYALYLGLFEEAKGDGVNAKKWILVAASSKYVTPGGDYMGAVAVVHAHVRGWLNATAATIQVV